MPFRLLISIIFVHVTYTLPIMADNPLRKHFWLSQSLMARMKEAAKSQHMDVSKWLRMTIETVLQPRDRELIRQGLTDEIMAQYANMGETSTAKLMELKRLIDKRNKTAKEILSSSDSEEGLTVLFREYNMKICKLVGV